MASTAYHHLTNGPAERTTQTTKQALQTPTELRGIESSQTWSETQLV